MATTEQEIDGFAEFAKAQLGLEKDLSLDDLLDQWRLQHPPTEDAVAVKASLRDMDRGETGRPFERFAADFRKRNSIPEKQ